MSIVNTITLPENPTADELRAAAKQARAYAEERQGQVDMWNTYAGVLERRADDLAKEKAPQ